MVKSVTIDSSVIISSLLPNEKRHESWACAKETMTKADYNHIISHTIIWFFTSIPDKVIA